MELTRRQIEAYFEEPDQISEAHIYKLKDGYKIIGKNRKGIHSIGTIGGYLVDKLKDLEKSKNFTVRIKRNDSQEQIWKKIEYMRSKVIEFISE